MTATKYMHLLAGTDGSPYIPGDGEGSALLIAASARNITAIVNKTTLTLNSVAGILAEMLVVTIDGFWGTVAEVGNPGATDIRVHQWRHRGARREGTPTVQNAALSAFPDGSCLANMQAARIERLFVTAAVTGASANYILDHRLATGTPILPWPTAAGVGLGSHEVDIDVASPFFLQIGAHANTDITLTFKVDP